MTAILIPVLIWWLILQALGWLALPIAMRIFRWLPDRGYIFSKTLGLLLASYILWLGASTGLLHNNLSGIIFSVIVLAGISAWLYFRGGEEPGRGIDVLAFLRRNGKLIVIVEVLFAVALLFWAFLRAYATFKIDNAGGEKFMEIAFLNAILRSDSFPPHDPWLSGFAISYYYFGYVMMAMLTRLSGVASGVGFDLYDALLFALTVLGTFGVVYNLVASAIRRSQSSSAQPSQPPTSALASGALGVLLVVVMGNLHGVWESLRARGILPESFWQWLAIPELASVPPNGTWYPGVNPWGGWWWRASRVLNDVNLVGQPMGVQPINEFPFFSFLLGDNHPHVLALPFVLLAIALAFNFLRRQFLRGQVELVEGEEAAPPPAWWNPVAYALEKDYFLFFASAIMIGALGFLNTWDMPIYWGLLLLAYTIGAAAAQGRLDRPLLSRAVSLGLGWALVCGLLYIFFYLSFDSQASGILPYIFPPTRLPQYLTMFGTFIVILLCFLAFYLAWQAQSQAGILRQAGAWWLRMAALWAALFILILLFIALLGVIAPDPLQQPVVQQATGGLGLVDALQASLVARLRNPWLFLLCTAMMGISLAISLASMGGSNPGIAQGDPGAAGADPQAGAEPLKASPKGAALTDQFVFLLIFIGIALTFVVEFIYLRDTFGVRMNTVFKFYYQGWVMMGCASAYAVWWLLNHIRQAIVRFLFSAVVLILMSAGLLFTVMGIHSRADAFQGIPNLDGASNIAKNHPEDWAAIEWLIANARSGMGGGAPVILEAPGDSYDYEGRISAFTGYPAVLGWALHESQWRGSYDEQALREPDIRTIYTTSDAQEMLQLLHKWNVRYVILGFSEMNYLRLQCMQVHCNLSAALRKFDFALEPVFVQGETVIYRVP
ncbi:MAG: hypothetical protein JW726_18340 [Anaerolineales bacterium]|nr:hypothetical protein [Anaerolineales bacterium]